MKSISNRICKGIFLLGLISILVLIMTVLMTNEALETTMLNAVPEGMPQVQLSEAQKTEAFVWDGMTNKIVFVPHGTPVPHNMPELFMLNGSERAAEVELGDETFLVNIQHTEDGTLYWARNISAFETREDYLLISLLLIVGAMIVFSLLLAIASSRNIVRPLQQLSRQIGALPVGKEMPPLGLDYRDQELHDIATTFNRFLNELNAYVEREQRLLNLASHELRTPIMVTAGALDVIERRGQLAANDQVTLRRIRMANDEMAENVKILLELARPGSSDEDMLDVTVNDCVAEILQDLQTTLDVEQRVRIRASDKVYVPVQPAMLKMLLRNVIQNALLHTTGVITIDIRATEIIVHDQGTGGITLPHPAFADVSGAGHESGPPPGHDVSSGGMAGKSEPGGLGLYVVTLICERLGWSLTVESRNGQGSSVRIVYGSGAGP